MKVNDLMAVILFDTNILEKFASIGLRRLCMVDLT